MTPLEIVKSTYESATPEQNASNLERHMAADAIWTETAGSPYAGTFVGFAEIAQNVFARLGGEWADYRFEPERYLADDETVVAIGTYTGVYHATGKPMKARVVHIWRIASGKIAAFEQVVDSNKLTEAMN
ncbi:hypothetical protein CLV80_11834 [Yoonia maritima]|uniref:SnoaL-like domain-containing protein n=1 Tax=Yoonia maritima TaxID=1435347 RepID=A0A2T0VTW8_9RHOB|nr:nuclear transport factor 2 family protein [Yoonia maritima]PRY74397.1 hypothetical protein CLV80_11834 [Yoonia maritima]